MKKKLAVGYFQQIKNWIFRGKYYILSIFSITLTFLYKIKVIDFHPTTIAFFMTTIGLFIIFLQQIMDANEFTDQNPNTLGRWLRSFPTVKHNTIHASANITLPSVKLTATAKVSISEETTIEQKVNFILSQLEQTHNEIININNRINDFEKLQEDSISKLRTDLDQLNLSHQKLIAGHAVGNYDLNFFGFVLTLSGTIIQYSF